MAPRMGRSQFGISQIEAKAGGRPPSPHGHRRGVAGGCGTARSAAARRPPAAGPGGRGGCGGRTRLGGLRTTADDQKDDPQRRAGEHRHLPRRPPRLLRLRLAHHTEPRCAGPSRRAFRLRDHALSDDLAGPLLDAHRDLPENARRPLEQRPAGRGPRDAGERAACGGLPDRRLRRRIAAVSEVRTRSGFRDLRRPISPDRPWRRPRAQGR